MLFDELKYVVIFSLIMSSSLLILPLRIYNPLVSTIEFVEHFATCKVRKVANRLIFLILNVVIFMSLQVQKPHISLTTKTLD